jgi:segregation and condensation protein B
VDSEVIEKHPSDPQDSSPEGATHDDGDVAVHASSEEAVRQDAAPLEHDGDADVTSEASASEESSPAAEEADPVQARDQESAWHDQGDPAVAGSQQFLPEPSEAERLEFSDDVKLRAVIEALVYVTEEPITPAQIANVLQQAPKHVEKLLGELAAEYEKPEHGLAVREVAGGYKMATKPEHHDSVRAFAKSLKPPLKLSLAALETLSVIAYKQPITAPEIMEIRGVQGAGVLKTLIDRKLIAPAGRKQVIGKPILYKTTKDFLVQFGLKDLSELPSLKEFEEIRRMAFNDEPGVSQTGEQAAEAGAESSDSSAPTPADAVVPGDTEAAESHSGPAGAASASDDQPAGDDHDAEPSPAEEGAEDSGAGPDVAGRSPASDS